MKRKRSITINCFLLALLFTCCTGANKSETKEQSELPVIKPFVINLEEGIDNFQKIKLSTIADSIQYVQLETSPKCLLNELREIKLTKESIFVSDFEGIYKFSRDGKFLTQIGSKGNGPGEYKNIRTFTIDTKNQLIYAVFHWKKMIGIYNFDGNYLQNIKCNFNVEKIALYGNDALACSLPCGGYVDNDYNLYIIDKNTGVTIEKFEDYYNIKGMHSFNFSTLQTCENTLFFNDTFCDTLFSVDNNLMLAPHCVFNFGKLKICDTKSDIARVSFVNRIFDYNKHILFHYSSPVKDYFVRAGLYNKQTNTTLNLSLQEKGYNGLMGFYNDFDGIIHLWPRFIGENNEFVNYFDLLKLKKMTEVCQAQNVPITFSNNKQHETINALLKSKNYNSNGVVTIVYPKKDF